MGDSAGAIDMEHTHTNGIEQQQPVKVTAEQLGVSQGEQYQGDLHFDLGNMMACEQGPIDRERFQREPDAACQELATQITQSLVAQLFQLPSEAAPVGRIAQLPPPSTPLPRAKPLPKPREPTKWEAFAQRKGIVKRKRGKEVFDEEAGEYRRRHGYKRAGDEAEVPIIEASASDAVGDDPFSALKAEKKERVREQHKRQLSNLKASAKAAGRGAAALPPTLRLAAGLPAHGKGRLLKRAEVKEDIKAASAQAGVSTASMGKFDERLAGEKPGERTAGRKRQKFEAVAGRTKAENEKALGVVDRILRERADDILDTDRAVRRVEAERHRHIGSNSGGRDQARAAPDDSDDDDGKGSKKKQHGRKGGKPTSTKGQRFAGLKRGDGGVAKRGGKGRPAPGSKGRPSPGGKGRPAPGGRGAAGKGRPAGRGGGRGGKRQ